MKHHYMQSLYQSLPRTLDAGGLKCPKGNSFHVALLTDTEDFREKLAAYCRCGCLRLTQPLSHTTPGSSLNALVEQVSEALVQRREMERRIQKRREVPARWKKALRAARWAQRPHYRRGRFTYNPGTAR